MGGECIVFANNVNSVGFISMRYTCTAKNKIPIKSCVLSLIFFPPQLFSWLKQVRFLVANTSMYFDTYGDPPTGYDIICWIWRGTKWSLRLVGSFSPDPILLIVDAFKIEWHTGDSRTVRTFLVCLGETVKNVKQL